MRRLRGGVGFRGGLWAGALGWAGASPGRATVAAMGEERIF